MVAAQGISTGNGEKIVSLGGLGVEREFQNYVQGTYGEFSTPAGSVSYLLTKARLGGAATDPERRLTQHLAPVREVMPAEELDFSQLLQRDLDDHRVAVSLVPYLLSSDWNGPAFFPPVVAILLPFEDQRPSAFPVFEETKVVVDDDLSWDQQDAGDHLRVRRLLNDNGMINPVPLGRVYWNGEFTRIVVVDGQHRAMALLAIERTIRSKWQGSGGERYKYFYENRIKELLKPDDYAKLDRVEIPVSLLWFPDRFGPGKEPHKAARKLFVDVNKEARRPSESRLILLSDSELVNIFTRTVLTELKNQSTAEHIPLFCIEYDNPDTKTTQSARWSALTNIHILKQMVTRTIFGPPKYIVELNASIGAREPESEKNAYMRTQLAVDGLFGPVIDGDEPFKRDDLGNKSFPPNAVQPLANAFREGWGRALLILLSNVHPFKAHADALAQLKENWLPDEAIAQLAFDALFNGVGMYWTLRESANYYGELQQVAGATVLKPDVVKAWELIATKQKEFETIRATFLVGDPGKLSAANQMYLSANTHACQLGLALTLGSVNRFALIDSKSSVVSLARAMVSAVNTWMASRVSGQYDRRLVLAKQKDGWPNSPLNLIGNMDAPRAVQFRYFWLEILAAPEAAIDDLTSIVDVEKIREMRDEARRGYVDYIAREKLKALKTTQPQLSEQKRTSEASKQANSEVRSALSKWFGINAAEWAEWLSSGSSIGGSGGDESEVEDGEVDGMDDDVEEPTDESVSIEDLVDQSE